MPKEDEQRRQRAIDRYLAGDPIEDICRELACSKSWLYKWRDRYQATAPSWSAALSRSPRTTPTKTPTGIAQAVVSLHYTLAQHGESCGAAAIK
jgi:transposase-like protein